VLALVMDLYTSRRVVGREHLDDVTGPVVRGQPQRPHGHTGDPARAARLVAAAHSPGRCGRLRLRQASQSPVRVAGVRHRAPRSQQRRRGGARSAAHLDRLIDDGGSLLVFAEGTRSRDGRGGRLRSGAALLAAEHHLPIVSIYVSGTRDAMPRGHHWMVFKTGRPGPRHQLEIRFGSPIVPRAGERPSEVMERVRLFLAECGAETEREPETGHAQRRQPV
jgi:1-acyl-sn-glycerol-3-phosphate acyltransferase